MAEKIMVTWLTEMCNRRPGALLKKRRIVVLLAFKGHLPFIVSGWIIKFFSAWFVKSILLEQKNIKL